MLLGRSLRDLVGTKWSPSRAPCEHLFSLPSGRKENEGHAVLARRPSPWRKSFILVGGDLFQDPLSACTKLPPLCLCEIRCVLSFSDDHVQVEGNSAGPTLQVRARTRSPFVPHGTRPHSSASFDAPPTVFRAKERLQGACKTKHASKPSSSLILAIPSPRTAKRRASVFC